MEIRITDSLKLQCEIPFVLIEKFQFVWEPNQHAVLGLEGYINGNEQYITDKLYDSKIKIWMEKKQSKRVLFCGYLIKVNECAVGKTKRVKIQAASGSYKLDQCVESKSFQNTESTYADIVMQTVENAGGKVICTEGINKKISKPVIQYNETAWGFAKRMASQVGAYLFPDIETGGINLWFGEREGNATAKFSETEYVENMYREIDTNTMKSYYEIDSKEFYEIGDKAKICGLELQIWEVKASFERGELNFKYILKKNASISTIYQNQFVGLGLQGTVVETRGEQIKVALDIDGGKTTGDYFYDWYPETGNALYAMPEIGTQVLLYFNSKDEREGFVLHSLPNSVQQNTDYKNRYFNTKEGNTVHLYKDSVDFSCQGNHNLALADSFISAGSSGTVSISAQGSVKLSARRITISTPDELNICQG